MPMEKLVDALKMDSEALKERVRWAITYVADNRDLSNEKLAKILGYATSTINSYRRKITVPGLDFFALFIYKYEFSLVWFTTGRGEPFPGARKQYPEICGPDTTSPFSEDEAPGEFVYIPQMGGRISAGGGLVPDNTVEMKIAFRKAWIQRRGDPANMTLIKVSGDSMEPTLLSGDMVLIDRSRDYLDPQGGIYAIALDDAIMIKRLLADPSKKIRIISDNRNYPAIEADPDQVKINGKVIWFARELER
jgi:phage repressor protein C with HTH and peptisase S24 domain